MIGRRSWGTKRPPGLRKGKNQFMEKLNPSFPTVVTIALSCLAVFYFLMRFVIRKNLVSLALVFMGSGWSVCALVMNGYIPRRFYDFVCYLGMLVSLFLVTSLLMVEFWEDYRRDLAQRKHDERLDRELRERFGK